MDNFSFITPTRYVYGKESELQTGELLKPYGKKVLVVCNQNQHLIKSGTFKRIIDSIEKENITPYYLKDIQPNPRLSKVNEGIAICRTEGITSVLAIGGGSLIDTAKFIALGANYSGDVWDFITKGVEPKDVLPVGVVATIAAAGSEGSGGVVITNEDGMLKRPYGHDKLRPAFSILNPELTYSVSPYQTACGSVDIVMHVLERYFTNTKGVDLNDRLCEGIVKSVIDNATTAYYDPENYDARGELLWASIWAHNDLLTSGRGGDYVSHFVGHELSAKFDIAHGATLSVIVLAWMRFVYQHDISRFCQFATRVFNIEPDFKNLEETAIAGIDALEEFFLALDMPTMLCDFDLDITDEDIDDMATKATMNGNIGGFVSLSKDDIIEIFNLAR